jgi:hypothetical protein
VLNDLWRFDPTTIEWTWMSGSDSGDPRGIYGAKNVGDLLNFPGGKRFPSSWYDRSGKFWLFGGGGFDSDSNQGTLNDLWYFTRIPPVPAPDRAKTNHY